MSAAPYQPLSPWSPDLCALRERIEADAFDRYDPLSLVQVDCIRGVLSVGLAIGGALPSQFILPRQHARP